MPVATARALGERKLISAMRSAIRKPRGTIADLHDDAAIFKLGGAILAVSTDMGFGGTHFVSRDPVKMGRKIAVACNTDLLAKGALPKFMWLDVGFPPQTPVSFVKKLYSGIDFELRRLGSHLIGGDTNNSPQFAYSATVLGEIRGKPLLRSTARAGDVLVLTGEVGNAAAGLFCALEKRACAEKFLGAQTAPKIDFALCKKLMPLANAGIDVSDGLAFELGEIARQSGKKIVVDFGRVPFDKSLHALCEKNGWSLEDLLFHRGEDYQVVYSVPASKAGAARRAGGIIFGKVLPPAGGGEGGVFLQKGGKMEKLRAKGYEHFKSN
ncbi:MAG: thiamine-phosphate kinase [Candidatus Micrarchaeia archaeon]|jgi:thiamine-monophosphate kinase